MRTIEKLAAQGDCIFQRVDEIPEDATEVERNGNEPLVVAHSETGHHHVVRARHARMFATASALVGYLLIAKKAAEVEHLRDYDTHEPIALKPGKWKIRRQRERAPEGWRRVAD